MTYSTDTTSFAKTLGGAASSLGSRGALLIADHIDRTELVLRQLVRDGKVGPGAGNGPLVLATVEGMSAARIAQVAQIFEGVWIAPAALGDPSTRAFEEAHRNTEGTLPGDQALLVFRALLGAAGGPHNRGRVALAQVQKGELHVQTPATP